MFELEGKSISSQVGTQSPLCTRVGRDDVVTSHPTCAS